MKEGKTRNSESIIRDINVTGITEHEHIVKKRTKNDGNRNTAS